MIKLVEIYKDTVREAGSWHLREIFINPDYIVFMREDPTMGASLVKDDLPDGLLPQQSFTRIGTSQSKNSADIVVVGGLEQVRSKIAKHGERLTKNRALLLEG
jgi:hypothetical protein